jgi:hypothetical protein
MDTPHSECANHYWQGPDATLAGSAPQRRRARGTPAGKPASSSPVGSSSRSIRFYHMAKAPHSLATSRAVCVRTRWHGGSTSPCPPSRPPGVLNTGSWVRSRPPTARGDGRLSHPTGCAETRGAMARGRRRPTGNARRTSARVHECTSSRTPRMRLRVRRRGPQVQSAGRRPVSSTVNTSCTPGPAGRQSSACAMRRSSKAKCDCMIAARPSSLRTTASASASASNDRVSCHSRSSTPAISR